MAADILSGAHSADADNRADESGVSDAEDELDQLDLRETSAKPLVLAPAASDFVRASCPSCCAARRLQAVAGTH